MVGRDDDQNSMMFADIKQLTENPPDQHMRHSQTAPNLSHPPYDDELAKQFGNGTPSRRVPPTPAPRHSLSLSPDVNQTAIQNTLTDRTLVNPATQQFNTQVLADQYTGKHVTQGAAANVTPAMNQAKAFTELVLPQNQTPVNQSPPPNTRPKQYHNKPTNQQTDQKQTNQQTGQRPPTVQTGNRPHTQSQYGQSKSGAQSLRLDMTAAASPANVSPRQQGVPAVSDCWLSHYFVT